MGTRGGPGSQATSVWRAADNLAPEPPPFAHPTTSPPSSFDRDPWTRGEEGAYPSYPYGSPPSGVLEQLEAPPAAERQSFGRWLFEMLVLVGIAFLLASGIKAYVIQPFIIPSLSMAPTLEINDRVLVNKFLYRFADPERGDIVVFLEPGSQKTDYIKRVIATEGETVDVRDGLVYVDGVPVDEPYVHGVSTEAGDIQMPVTIPKGYVFLMGDNRQNSRDSRWFGPQPLKRVLGKAFAIYWPPSRLRTF